MKNKNFSDLTKFVNKLTKNKQDSEDAIQDAHIAFIEFNYEMTSKNIKNKSFQIAKNNFRDNKDHRNCVSIEKTFNLISNWDINSIYYRNSLKKLYKSITPDQKKMLDILMESDCNYHMAARNSEFSIQKFKTLFHILRKNFRREDFL